MDDHTLPAVPDRLLRALLDRERLLHFPDPGIERAEFESGIVHDYWEIGASGGRFDTDVIWEVVCRRAATGEQPPWHTEDEECRLLAPRTYLLTYLLIQGERRTRRSTIWRGAGTDWVAVYHQGTVVTGEW